jgi:sugar (pentulose or hexulose) kinase
VGDGVWVGIDLGTQSVRAVAVGADGGVRGRGSEALSGVRDGVRHEQDPYTWWRAVAGACRQALDGVPPEAVRGVAVDGTSGTVLLTDGRGEPLTPALMYDDTRAAAEPDLLDRINTAGADVWTALGYRRMQPAWALPKVLWLLRHHGVPGGEAYVTHQTDYVTRRLAGHPVATDLSTALKTGADLIGERWPADVMDALGVPPGLLPPLVRSGTEIGAVSAAAAAETAIPAGTPIVAGCTDGCAAQLATGRLRVGSWNSVLGTTLVLKGVTDDLVQDPSGVVYSHRAPDGRWLPGGASSTGAGLLTRDFPGRDLAALDDLARAYEPAGVVAYPLVSAGERFPFVAPDARGFQLGEPADEAERFAAVLQGIAYVERLCFDYLDMLGAPTGGALTLTGGSAKSAYWNQLRADVLGRPVELPADAEPARGMAILASAAHRPITEAAAAMGPPATTVEPRATHTGRFDDAYLRLVAELAQRGWLPEPVAAHVQERTTR